LESGAMLTLQGNGADQFTKSAASSFSWISKKMQLKNLFISGIRRSHWAAHQESIIILDLEKVNILQIATIRRNDIFSKTTFKHYNGYFVKKKFSCNDDMKVEMTDEIAQIE
jgi:hypothetical protein